MMELLETIVDGVMGIHFNKQNKDEIINAVFQF